MQSTMIPLVKNKCGDLSDLNNYRAIALSSALSKILETLLAVFLHNDSEVDCFQFGFKSGHSTGLCTSVLKQTLITIPECQKINNKTIYSIVQKL